MSADANPGSVTNRDNHDCDCRTVELSLLIIIENIICYGQSQHSTYGLELSKADAIMNIDAKFAKSDQPFFCRHQFMTSQEVCIPSLLFALRGYSI